jgi:FixJ family two-component response regulator
LIAIVDDDVSVCRAIKRLVWTHGIRAETFTSGVDFLVRIESTPSFEPECVILDVHMPGFDGFQVRSHLARVRPHIPVIFLTARPVPGRHRERLARGAMAFFQKPFDGDLDAFVRTLRTVLKMGGPVQ